VVWCGAAEPSLLEFGRDCRLLSLVSQLTHAKAFDQLINQAHFKLPGDEVTFEWHQDSKHRRYGTDLWTDVDGRGSFIETTTAIDPMTEENGPLQFIPGSHEGGHIQPDPDTGQLPDDAFDPSDAVTLTMNPGDVALFGPYAIHGSGPNNSEMARRLFLNGFALPGANRRVYPGEGAGRRVRLPARAQ
jgi:ectoine hydroxylase-related dioxygenase (phytanoyl-CoA dioxygenase family)